MAEQQPMDLQNLCYETAEDRQSLAALVCEEGVVDVRGGDLLVTTGANNLDLIVAFGGAYIAGDDDAPDQGMYRVRNDAPTTLVGLSTHGVQAADGTNPRIDQVVATVRDGQYGGLDNDWILDVVEGTPTPGATLTNLSGAAALPSNSIRLAYILVPATFTGPFVNATHILDARGNFLWCGAAPWVSIEASAATSSANAVYTQTALATLVHLDRDFFSVSGNTITILQDGLYDINAMAGFNSIGTGGSLRSLLVTKNNTNLPNANPDGVWVASDRGDPTNHYAKTLTREQIQLSAGDTLKLSTYQNTGGAVNTFHSAGSYVAHLTVRKVG